MVLALFGKPSRIPNLVILENVVGVPSQADGGGESTSTLSSEVCLLPPHQEAALILSSVPDGDLAC